MSILTELFEGKITFGQASEKATGWAQALTSKDPALAAAVGASLSIIKQGASNAIMLADTELGQYIHPAAVAVETALDAALAGATRGASLPFNPIVNSSIDQMAATVKAAADAWALQAKSNLTGAA